MSVLSDWVDVLPTTVAQIQMSIDNVDVQLADLGAKKTALEGVLTSISTGPSGMSVYLLTKALSGDDGYVYTYGDYGTANVTEFKVYGIIDTEVTYDSPTTFTCDSSASGLFSVGQQLGVDCGVDGIQDTTVLSVSGAGTLTISVSGDSITSNLVKAMHFDYEYGGINWDSDATVLQFISDFAFVLDFLNKTLGVDGTYGINDMISKLGIARGLLVINKNKYNNGITILGRYD